jgi:hypothetical protein
VLNLNIVIGSIRDGRAADRVVPWLSRRVETRDVFTTELVDLREWALPMFAETVQTVGDFSNPTYSQPLVRSAGERHDPLGGNGDTFGVPARDTGPQPTRSPTVMPRTPGPARDRVPAPSWPG